MPPDALPREPLTVMADGTVKQVNPYSGTEVWTVPGRGDRPLTTSAPEPTPLDPELDGRHCAFCSHRYLETPPEKARIVRTEVGDADPSDDGGYEGGGYDGGEGWRMLHRIDAAELTATTAEFRRIPNLFEIVSYDYWRKNYGYALPAAAAAHRERYLASAEGRDHALRVAHARWSMAGHDDAAWNAMSPTERLATTDGFFGGGHDVIVGRRHYVDGATDSSRLASSGTLTPDEHAQYVEITVDALRDLYATIPHARHVAVFQNWLRPAGASFDHLHKQLVAVDEPGVQIAGELARLRSAPDLYNTHGVDYAAARGLVVAENAHAVAVAGVGHRYPALDLYSTSARTRPWEQTREERRGMSDLLHALHAATGPQVACNEEWHHESPDSPARRPWRIVLKWRTSTLAGFEGGTRIYLNTIDPWRLRDRVVDALLDLRERGAIAPGIDVGDECSGAPGRLRYLEAG